MLDPLEILDLHFQDRPETIASYLLPHEDGVALIETGPGSTFPMLQAHLADRGFTPADVSDVLLTHIHLDHAGAAGHLAQHGATIYVHEVGVSHLRNPERLLASAERIYGDDMDRLWGEMHPVPSDQIVPLQDQNTVPLGSSLSVRALDTPGHASHHMSYLVGDVCFTGDVGGVRLPGEMYVELPLAPPEIDLDQWRQSLSQLRTAVADDNVRKIAPTHFGLYDDVSAHLDRLEEMIDVTDAWTENTLPSLLADDGPLEETVVDWMHELAVEHGVEEKTWEVYELANPSWMAALGLKRYWRKHRA